MRANALNHVLLSEGIVVRCSRLTIRTHDWFLGWETQRKSQSGRGERDSVSRQESFKEKPERAIWLKVYKISGPSSIALGPLWQVRVLSSMWQSSRTFGPPVWRARREAQQKGDGTSDDWWENMVPAEGWRRSDALNGTGLVAEHPGDTSGDLQAYLEGPWHSRWGKHQRNLGIWL